ncbi:amino acid permease [Streptomyces sioyaensis]|uniref:amino acid permease n=1 Tax=Streptomyces sioyaensis TaxID=67364 RepID=UPI0037B29A12
MTTDRGDHGYRKGLKARHIKMMAVGTAIGTGLFLGTGGRLAKAGPALLLSYAICGLFAYFVVRALGELILYRPSSGSFVSYAREFLGEKGAYIAGWMYFLNWTTGGIADITAAALYAHYWSMFTDIPQWLLALLALAIVLSINLISVKIFGELEFWFALLKVVAISAFLVIGVFLLVKHHEVGGYTPGAATMLGHGGLFPNGVIPVIFVMQGVIFAYSGVELVGITAGETAQPHSVVPRAVNSIIWRIALFYIGSVLLLILLMPWQEYSGDQSPFVTVLTKLGLPAAGDVMNLVVLTAALSSLNSGLYSTGRILRSMAMNGSAPGFSGRMSRRQVPYAGILLTAAVCVLGVGLNYVVPQRAFEIVLNVSSLGVISTWSIIMLCHLAFVRRAKAGQVERPAFRLPLSPVTQIATIAFLLGILVLMWCEPGVGRKTVMTVPLIAAALVGGWFCVRRRLRTRERSHG